MSPLRWLWDARNEKWYSFVPVVAGHTSPIAVHTCPTWDAPVRDWRTAEPQPREVFARGSALARKTLKSITEKESP
jgi:hypothetical protein